MEDDRLICLSRAGRVTSYESQSPHPDWVMPSDSLRFACSLAFSDWRDTMVIWEAYFDAVYAAFLIEVAGTRQFKATFVSKPSSRIGKSVTTPHLFIPHDLTGEKVGGKNRRFFSMHAVWTLLSMSYCFDRWFLTISEYFDTWIILATGW